MLKEALVTEICANIGAKLPGAAYTLKNGVFVDPSEKFLAKTEGMRKFEPVLKRFICRHLLQTVEGSNFVPTYPLDQYIGNDYFPWPVCGCKSNPFVAAPARTHFGTLDVGPGRRVSRLRAATASSHRTCTSNMRTHFGRSSASF
jgi:hypothetical protein